jgi:hypothetical protein
MRRLIRWLNEKWLQAQFDAVMRQREAECRKNAADYAAKRDGGTNV